jgi:hypothetical protein
MGNRFRAGNGGRWMPGLAMVVLLTVLSLGPAGSGMDSALAKN